MKSTQIHHGRDPDPCELLRAAIETDGSATTTARRLGCSTSYVLDVRHGRRPASKRLLAALGYERRIVPVDEAAL